MAECAGIKHLVMTHLIPSLDSASHGPFVVRGGPPGHSDFVVPARESGFQGEIYVGRDLMSTRLQQ
jgi:ribonuclease Z